MACAQCNGKHGPTRWWVPLLQENLCHVCYQRLITGMPQADLDDLRREPKDLNELEEKRRSLWSPRPKRAHARHDEPRGQHAHEPRPRESRELDDSEKRFSLLELK